MDNSTYDTQLTAYLAGFVTEHKKTKIQKVLADRTRALTIVLEDIFKPHNASAVLRTAECFGVQDIHVTEDFNPYNVNPYVTRGAGKWLTLHRYNEEHHHIASCVKRLKAEGYQIVATSPGAGAINYTEFTPKGKIALVFGAEETGISDYVRSEADQLIKIPMYGFTESFNISVSAGILIEYFQLKLKQEKHWNLSSDEIAVLTLEWYQKIVPKINKHIKYFDEKIFKIN